MGFSMDRTDPRSNTKHGEAVVDAIHRYTGRPAERQTWAEFHSLRGQQDSNRAALKHGRQEAVRHRAQQHEDAGQMATQIQQRQVQPQATHAQQHGWTAPQRGQAEMATQQQAYERELQQYYQVGQLVTLANGQQVPLTMAMVHEHLQQEQQDHHQQQHYYADQLQQQQLQRQHALLLKQQSGQSAAPLDHDVDRMRRIDSARRQQQQYYAELQAQQQQAAEQPTGGGSGGGFRNLSRRTPTQQAEPRGLAAYSA